MIVRTKLIVPEQRSEMVLRQHLTDRLAAGEKRPLILITGCAGAGKTALAVKWLSQKDRHPAWYTLDPRDNDPGLFLRHLLISLLSISDPIDKAVGPLLQGHRSVADPDVAAAVLDAFSAEAGPVYLVFDNFHVLTCRPILDFVAHLIQYAPKAFHLVIISRSQPPFPLSRLRAGNRITELHPEALKFSRDETRFYLTRVAGLDLRPDQADTIFEATEGWISGLVLTRAALHRKDPVSAISNITPFVENAVVNEYFNEEVIDTLPPDLQDFLLTICILNRFNAALCREVTGRTGCRDVLTTLYRNHSFIISLDAGGEWFRFHRLFARALRNHPHAISPQKAVLLHKKAALWNARHYLLDQAFDHALKAYDTEFLADLMEDHLMFYFLECDFEPVCRLLDALPAQRIDTSLILSVYRLLVLISTWDLIQAPGLFKALERRKTELLDQCPDRKKEFALALWALAGHAMAAAHDPALCRLDQLTRDIDHMPETYPLLTLFLSELRLLIQLDRGDLSLSHAFIEDQKELYQTLGIGFGYFTLLRAYAQIEIAMGNMTRATQRLGQWFDQAAGTGISAAPTRPIIFI
ncbi:hypothetical protein [uncultured Desulfobacter sp.]|uniref:hypothetical protein n=1 Tax=uncultured Desulfobacter sp. TaxID=240139 RepID=UPI002AAA7045|nr:hypothetical protein [uncultured Desulfobacter sp.]